MKLTDKQQEIVDLKRTGLTSREIANQLGLNKSTVNRHLQAAKKKAMHEDADIGYYVTGKSTLYDRTGKNILEWVKTGKDKESLEQLQEAFRAAVEDAPKLDRIKTPKKSSKDLLAVYPMGDPHIGMYAWAEEAGEDFDCDIAQNDLLSAVDNLVSVTPECEQCLIVNLGDFFHSDNMAGVTSRSNNSLDVDTRWPRVLQLGIAAMIRVIQRALEKHKHVTVINAIGNHDDQSSIMLAVALGHAFSGNPRVDVQQTINAFHYYEFGQNLIGVHHGHSVKKERLPGLMATDRSEAWGRTKHRYWLTGHIHHKTVYEIDGTIVESFRTLAGKDAYHTNQGYRAGRDMNAIIYHKDYGETDRYRCDILRARAA